MKSSHQLFDPIRYITKKRYINVINKSVILATDVLKYFVSLISLSIIKLVVGKFKWVRINQ